MNNFSQHVIEFYNTQLSIMDLMVRRKHSMVDRAYMAVETLAEDEKASFAEIAEAERELRGVHAAIELVEHEYNLLVLKTNSQY